MTTTTPPESQTYQFQAEIKQLLDILVHSVYTSKDVFIRELISNATDALEKVRFLQVEGRTIHSPELPLEIRIETKKEADLHQLIISDTGIGMTADEVRENIGTIAHSGTSAFVEQLKAASGDEEKKLSLIGRFGVGFYSVFMAADKVELTTRAAAPDAQGVRWISDGLGTYTLENLSEDIPRGTQIVLTLKPDEARFAEVFTVRGAIERYSNFIPFPIRIDGEQVNQTKALWREPASQVTDEQYNEFFRLIGHDSEDPLLHLHTAVDAPWQYSALLFIPASNPEAMGFGEGEVSLQLYVRRVLIDGENKHLLPRYLRFVRGVVESEDLPLNVSRETLQENRIVSKIREQLTKQLLDQLIKLAADDAPKYEEIWRTFNRIFKEGYSDYAHREKFQELLRFNSSRHENAEGLMSLADYVAALPEGQKAIYYLSGPSRDALLRDPRLELFRKKKIEVLYLTEMADEFVLSSLGKYKDHELVSADQVKLDDLKELGTKSEDKQEEKQEAPDDIAPLIVKFKEILGDRVIDVRASERLVDSPACLVGDESQSSAHMDRVMRLMNKTADLPQRVLEINPRHQLIVDLTKLVSKHSDEPLVALACEQLFEGAMLVDGYLADPHRLVERMHQVLADAAAMKKG